MNADKRTFRPWCDGLATEDPDGKTVTATSIVAPGLRLISAQVVDGAYLVAVFERTEETDQ